jgi:hypothetical protein
MKILKFLIPTGDKKEIKEVESFTVSWITFGRILDNEKIHNKVFVDESEAKEFKDNLIAAAEFLQLYLKNTPKITKN